MKRYEIRCRFCGELLGFGSFPGVGHPADHIDSTRWYTEDKIIPILCPKCEANKEAQNA